MDRTNIVLCLIAAVCAVPAATAVTRPFFAFPDPAWFMIAGGIACLFRVLLVFGELLVHGFRVARTHPRS